MSLQTGGLAHRSDLDEIQVGLLGQLECLVGRDDPDGLAVGAHEPDLGYPDPLVDTKLSADVSSSVVVVGSTPAWAENEEGSRSSKRKPVATSSPCAHAHDQVHGPDPTTFEMLCGRCGWETWMLLVPACRSAIRRMEGRSVNAECYLSCSPAGESPESSCAHAQPPSGRRTGRQPGGEPVEVVTAHA